MIVNGANGNVSIVNYSMSNSNLPFFQQHSVAVAIATALAIVVVIAVVIKVKNGEQPGKSELVENGQAN